MRLTQFILLAAITFVVSGCCLWTAEDWEISRKIEAKKNAEWSRMSADERLTLYERSLER